MADEDVHALWASIDCICSWFRSMDLYHVLIQYTDVCIEGQFFKVFSAFALTSGLRSLMLATLCHFLHLSLVPRFSCNCKVCKLHGFITIYQGSAR